MTRMIIMAGELSLFLTQFIVSHQSERAMYPSLGLVSGPYTVRTSSSANELQEAQRVKATPGNVVVQEYTRREIGGCFA